MRRIAALIILFLSLAVSTSSSEENTAPKAGFEDFNTWVLRWPADRNGNRDLPIWQPDHRYAVDDRIIPGKANGFYYRCIIAGESGKDEPRWPRVNYRELNDFWAKWKAYPLYDWFKVSKTGSTGSRWSADPEATTTPNGASALTPWRGRTRGTLYGQRHGNFPRHEFEVGFTRFDGGKGLAGYPHEVDLWMVADWQHIEDEYLDNSSTALYNNWWGVETAFIRAIMSEKTGDNVFRPVLDYWYWEATPSGGNPAFALHEAYYGADIPFELGKTYYWRIKREPAGKYGRLVFSVYSDPGRTMQIAKTHIDIPMKADFHGPVRGLHNGTDRSMKVSTGWIENFKIY